MAADAKRSLASASVWMMASTAAVNVAMLLYHREMSRRLGVGYADLAAVTGLINMAGLVLSGAAAWLTRTLSHEAAIGGEAAAVKRLSELSPALLGGGLALGALLWAAGTGLSDWLKLASPALIPWASAVVLGGLLMLMGRGLVQAAHRFGLLAFSYFFEAAAKVLVPVALVASMGVAGALAGMALVSAVLALVALPIIFRPRPGRFEGDAAEAPAAGWRGLARDSAALACFSLVVFLDLFVFKNAHGADDAAGVAFYSRAALAGKSFLYLASAFNLVALPAISAAYARGEDVLALLRRFLLAMGGVLALGLVALWAFTPLALRILLGDLPENAALVPVVRVFGLAVAPLALFQLVLYHGLAVGAPGFTRLLAATALLYFAALKYWHATPMQVLACLSVTALGLLLAGWALAVRDARRKRP